MVCSFVVVIKVRACLGLGLNGLLLWWVRHGLMDEEVHIWGRLIILEASGGLQGEMGWYVMKGGCWYTLVQDISREERRGEEARLWI